MTIEPWAYWLRVGTSIILIGILIKQMVELKKLRKQLAESEEETCKWIDKSTDDSKLAHNFQMELFKTEEARDAVLRLNVKQFNELQNYKTTMQEIAAGKHLFVRSKKYGYPESRVLSAQELAQNALKNGGVVRCEWEVRV